MIKNERQYRITRAEVRRFEESLGEMEGEKRPEDVSARLWEAQKEAVRSQLEELREEVAEFEKLGRRERTEVGFATVDELPKALIRARIAMGLTQEGLARKMGLKAQQVQRYEATEYESASFRRIREVVRALGVKLEREARLVG